MRILLLEDNPADAHLVVELLRFAAPQTRVEVAPTLRDAQKLLSQRAFEAAIVDLSLPDGRGLETLARVRSSAPEIPIVVLTGISDDALALEAVREGAQDYLVKGAHDGHAIWRSINYAIARQRRELGVNAVREEVMLDVRRHLELLEAEQRLLRRIVAPGPARARGAQRLAGRYDLVRQLAHGSSAEVWLARDATLERDVCAKIFRAGRADDAEAPRRFAREARLAGALVHPNIVHVYDFGYEGAQPFLVMEYVSGGSLADRLEAGALPSAEAARIVTAALHGLQHVHEHDLLHRDVKPANVLLAGKAVKLADFGLAIYRESYEGPQATQRGLAPPPVLTGGSPAYMSPEAALGAPLDARSDLYSMGATLYHCLAGRPYVDLVGMDAVAARRAIAEREPAPAAEDSPLMRVAFCAFDKEPERRPSSAGEMVRMIEAATSTT